jgi:broad specificity phosphatase PhoE
MSRSIIDADVGMNVSAQQEMKILLIRHAESENNIVHFHDPSNYEALRSIDPLLSENGIE